VHISVYHEMSESKEDSNKTSQLEAVTIDPLTEPTKQWVKFDDESQQQKQDVAPSEKVSQTYFHRSEI
jgi:hypothetical protein